MGGWWLAALILAVVAVAAAGAVLTPRLPAGRRWIGGVATFAIVAALPFVALAVVMLTSRSCGDGPCG